ncbi:MAG: alpha/beta hydrolase [Marinosulfonomonas sp.]|nr:alpha/beta hydrolase [Marinosulfonomonas sp.]
MSILTLPDGDQLCYQCHGSGPPLVLISGLAGLSGFWSPLLPELSKNHRVIVHDHRGTGKSSRRLMQFSVEQMAGDVLALMDELGVKKADIVGHSTGGAIAQVMAIEDPARVGKLVLSSTWPGPDAYFSRLFEFRKALLTQSGRALYSELSLLTTRPPEWIRDNTEYAAQLAAEKSGIMPDNDIATARIEALLRFDRRDEIHQITAATLVMGAADDTITPPYFIRELADRIPDACTHVFAFGGHALPQIISREYLSKLQIYLNEPNIR